MLTQKPKTQINHWENQNDTIDFFSDSDIRIKAKFDLDDDTGKVLKIIFSVKCFTTKKYRIKLVNYCKRKKTTYCRLVAK